MNNYAVNNAHVNAAMEVRKDEKKVSLAERFKNYMLENVDIIAPAIIMMNGGYYRPTK